MAKIILNKNEERRIDVGHQWIFSNEIEKITDFNTNGEVSGLFNSSGKFLGKGFYNKNSLIAYRHLTDKDDEINKAFFLKKINSANSLRKLRNSDSNVLRMVNSESDFLPGLIIDRFNDRYSIQIFSAGMENYINEVKEILIENFNAKLIIEKNNNEMRVLEGLEKREGVLFNDTGSDDLSFIFEIDDIKYKGDLLIGQKTGFYLDQSKSRKLIRDYIHGRHKVLDLFCNEGGFSLNCAYAGASEITGIDSSESSIKAAEENAALNNFTNIKFVCRDVFDFMNDLFQTKERFDVVILDPPSFTKSKKNLIPAMKGYIELNTKAMKLLKANSLLFTFSCSHHISDKHFEEIIIKSSVNSGRKIQVIEYLNCSFDHPVLIQMNETKYLKGYLLRVL